MVTDAAWYDLDKDKVNELVIVGEGMPITVFKLTKENFIEVTNSYFDKNYSGFWNKLLVDDVDGDGNVGYEEFLSGLKDSLNARK
jgi:hypothetical protein